MGLRGAGMGDPAPHGGGDAVDGQAAGGGFGQAAAQAAAKGIALARLEAAAVGKDDEAQEGDSLCPA